MDNPYVVEIINILNQIKGWIFALIGVVTVVIVVKNAFTYQAGDSAEKQEAARNIKRRHPGYVMSDANHGKTVAHIGPIG